MEAVQPRLIWVWLTAVATRLVGVVGGPVSGGGAPPTGVFMSAWIWAAVRAVLYTRTSSMRPAKYCP